MDILVNVALTAVGIVMLCYGGNWLVSGGVSIARRMGISSLVIGMTVVAYGTSTPELAASVAAAGKHGDIILGNIIGSNIANVGMVIGVAAVLATLVVGRQTIRREIPIMVGFSVLLIGLSVDGMISETDGMVLVALLVVFTVYTFRQARRTAEPANKEGSTASAHIKSVALLGVGVALLYVGAILTVDNAVVVAETFGIPERVIGITVIAIGTSLPEMITSVIAIRRGHTDIGVGNIIGSNIYNILLIMGVAATIAGIAVAPAVFTDYAIMVSFSLVLFAAMRSGSLGRKVGVGLVAAYAGYLLFSLMG